MSGRRCSRSRCAALLGAAVILAVGCATLPPPLGSRPSRAPIGPEARRLIDLLARRWGEFQDLRTFADVTIRQEATVRHLTGALLLRAPASLRFEALTPFGQPWILLAANAESFTLYQVAENRALVGPASPRRIEQWLGFPLEPDELVGVLSGHVLPMKDPRSAELIPADGLGLSIKITGAAGAQRIWMDPETGVVRQVELTGRKHSARVTYAGGAIGDPPSGLTVSGLETPLTVSVQYRGPRFRTGVPPDLFTLSLPEGTRIHVIGPDAPVPLTSVDGA